MTTDQSQTTEDSGIYELAPEEKAEPVERWIAPSEAAKQLEPLPCPQCKYDLSGLRSDRCPECGKLLTRAAVRQAENIRDGVNDSNWFDGRAMTLAAVGLTIGATVWAFNGGTLGLAAFGVYFTYNVIIGWLTFFFCSMLWIGFDQPLRKTVVQTIGAFGLYSGVSAGLSVLPLPGIVQFVIGAVVLIWMLSELLDIDLQDAAIMSVLVAALNVMIFMWQISSMLS